MLANEADDNLRPRNTENILAKRKNAKGYFIVIYLMFTMILMLCANSYMMFESYNSLQKRMNSISADLDSIEAERQSLAEEKQKVSEEHARFAARYDEMARQNEEILKQFDELRRLNDELIRRNQELTDDNVALQNSLKMAAAVGIKPQNYSTFKGLSSRSYIERGNYVGRFIGTAYTPSKEECGNNKGITNSGKPIIPGVSIAVDSKYWPFGTVFYIKGLGYAVAMDTGSQIKGKYRFDFSVFDRNFARTLGRRKWEVYLVRLGNGRVEELLL